MSKSIELPEPLFAEINGYAARIDASPVMVLKQAWDEFQNRHLSDPVSPAGKPTQAELLAMVESLRGSITLPAGVDTSNLIMEARAEKYGPL